MISRYFNCSVLERVLYTDYNDTSFHRKCYTHLTPISLRYTQGTRTTRRLPVSLLNELNVERLRLIEINALSLSQVADQVIVKINAVAQMNRLRQNISQSNVLMCQVMMLNNFKTNSFSLSHVAQLSLYVYYFAVLFCYNSWQIS